MKHLQKLYGASLALISLTTLITTVTGLIGIPLPPWAMRAIGVVGLISLPVLIYSSIMSMKEKAALAAKTAGRAGGKHIPVKAVKKGESTAAMADLVKSAIAEETSAAPAMAAKARPKPHPQQLAARRAAAGNRPKKGKKRK